MRPQGTIIACAGARVHESAALAPAVFVRGCAYIYSGVVVLSLSVGTRAWWWWRWWYVVVGGGGDGRIGGDVRVLCLCCGSSENYRYSLSDGTRADRSPFPAPRSHDTPQGPPNPKRSQASAPRPTMTLTLTVVAARREALNHHHPHQRKAFNHHQPTRGNAFNRHHPPSPEQSSRVELE